jgi:hypothetical protein
MDTVVSIIIYALIGLAAFVVIGYIGLKIPAPLNWPFGETIDDVKRNPPPDNLPQVVRRWLLNGQSTASSPVSVVAWGRGTIASSLPIIGRIWLPLSWTIYLSPGNGFIIQNRITWFRRRFIRGGEEYRNGKGTYILGSEGIEYPHLDETERVLGWVYLIWLAPGSLLDLPGIEFTSENDTPLLLVSEPEKEPLQFDLTFASDTGLLQSIRTHRKGSRSGQAYPYTATFNTPLDFENTGILPARFVGDWDGDVYLKLELAGIHYNQDVTEAMQTGIADLK